MLLQNPGGRFIEIDDLEEIEKLIGAGFRKATDIEENNWREERQIQYKIATGQMANPNAPVVYDENEDSDQYSIYFNSVSGDADGYGVSRMYIKRELQKLGVVVEDEFKHQKIGLLYHAPYSVVRLENQVKILYTMFESDKIPDDWASYLQRVDKIIVPSEWCAKAFRKAGFFPEVIPLGYPDNSFFYKERPDKSKTHEPFTFLHYNAFNLRKGFPELFKAFVKEFEPDENVRMIFKTTLEHIPLPISPSQYPNIEIIRGKKSEQEMVNICHRADCFVFPSRGEGFGMTPLEAMSTGMPAIVPNAHGISEYFDPLYMYEVKVKEYCPAIYSRYKNVDVGRMVVCDEEDLRRQMRYVVSHQDECREKGKAAAEYVKKYTFKQTAERLKVLFDKIVKEKKASSLTNTLALEAV